MPVTATCSTLQLQRLCNTLSSGNRAHDALAIMHMQHNQQLDQPVCGRSNCTAKQQHAHSCQQLKPAESAGNNFFKGTTGYYSHQLRRLDQLPFRLHLQLQTTSLHMIPTQQQTLPLKYAPHSKQLPGTAMHNVLCNVSAGPMVMMLWHQWQQSTNVHCTFVSTIHQWQQQPAQTL